MVASGLDLAPGQWAAVECTQRLTIHSSLDKDKEVLATTLRILPEADLILSGRVWAACTLEARVWAVRHRILSAASVVETSSSKLCYNDKTISFRGLWDNVYD